MAKMLSIELPDEIIRDLDKISNDKHQSKEELVKQAVLELISGYNDITLSRIDESVNIDSIEQELNIDIARLEPKKRYKIKANIKNIKKGNPVIVIPEGILEE